MSDQRLQSPASVPPATPAETRNWAELVLHSGCAQCGFAPGGLAPREASERVRHSIPSWQAVLDRPDVQVRPDPTTWSPLEYASHVRDLCRLAPARVAAMVSVDDPTCVDWDQDRAAVDGAYWSQDPAAIRDELTRWALAAAAVLDAVSDSSAERRGRRSDGSSFTVRTFGANLVHEIEHHVHDVDGSQPRYVQQQTR